MGFNLIRFSKRYVNSPTICPPTRDSGGIMLIGVCNPAVMLFLEFVVSSPLIGIAAGPELLYKILTLLFGLEVLKDVFFFVGDDVDYILLQPLLVILGTLLLIL